MINARLIVFGYPDMHPDDADGASAHQYQCPALPARYALLLPARAVAARTRGECQGRCGNCALAIQAA
jgi:hypothetical protein